MLYIVLCTYVHMYTVQVHVMEYTGAYLSRGVRTSTMYICTQYISTRYVVRVLRNSSIRVQVYNSTGYEVNSTRTYVLCTSYLVHTTLRCADVVAEESLSVHERAHEVERGWWWFWCVMCSARCVYLYEVQVLCTCTYVLGTGRYPYIYVLCTSYEVLCTMYMYHGARY